MDLVQRKQHLLLNAFHRRPSLGYYFPGRLRIDDGDLPQPHALGRLDLDGPQPLRPEGEPDANLLRRLTFDLADKRLLFNRQC